MQAVAIGLVDHRQAVMGAVALQGEHAPAGADPPAHHSGRAVQGAMQTQPAASADTTINSHPDGISTMLQRSHGPHTLHDAPLGQHCRPSTADRSTRWTPAQALRNNDLDQQPGADDGDLRPLPVRETCGAGAHRLDQDFKEPDAAGGLQQQQPDHPSPGRSGAAGGSGPSPRLELSLPDGSAADPGQSAAWPPARPSSICFLR